jgi:hypothetical protein
MGRFVIIHFSLFSFIRLIKVAAKLLPSFQKSMMLLPTATKVYISIVVNHVDRTIFFLEHAGELHITI